jgi:hypothetical protein
MDLSATFLKHPSAHILKSSPDTWLSPFLHLYFPALLFPSQRYPMDEASAAFAARIFPATGIAAGSSALPKDQLFKRMTRSEFVNYIRDTTVRPALKHNAFVDCCKHFKQGYQAAAVAYSCRAAAASHVPTFCTIYYAVALQLAAHAWGAAPNPFLLPALINRCAGEHEPARSPAGPGSMGRAAA